MMRSEAQHTVKKLLAAWAMQPGYCDLCTELLDNVTMASIRHIELLKRLSAAEIENASHFARIATLKRALETVCTRRKEAMQRYENHLLTHTEEALVAGGDSVLT